MKILVTSGSTIIKIDDVRHVGSFSSGEFPSQIAEEALRAGHTVVYLHAKRAKQPFAGGFAFDPAKKAAPQFARIKKMQKEFLKLRGRLKTVEYRTFDDYARSLKNIVSTEGIDIIFLGAAVSDYGMAPRAGKISSSSERLILSLTKTPKVIREVKKWSKRPVFQAGFKLLSGVSSRALIETAYKSGLESGSNITIANDLSKIRAGKREVILVTPEKGTLKLTNPGLAKKVFDFTLRRAAAHHFRTEMTTDKNPLQKYAREFRDMKKSCALLYAKGSMTPFYKGSHAAHGSIAARTHEGFLITARASNKERLAPDDVVLITGIDWEKRIIRAISPSGKKASLNAPLMQKIFDVFPETNIVIHTHRPAPLVPETSFPETPGTLEYALAPLPLLKKNRAVMLAHHGPIVRGDTIEETTRYAVTLSK
jgi:ribulose-5-phosphate 4-epimerase/fuculose-1-phosphate aldolase